MSTADPKPKKGDRYVNKKSGAVVEIAKRPAGGLVHLTNLDTGRKSQPKLDTLQKQYDRLNAGNVDDAPEIIASLSAEPSLGDWDALFHQGVDTYDEDDEDDEDDFPYFDGSTCDGDCASSEEKSDDMWLRICIASGATGFFAGTLAGVLLNAAL